MKQPLNKKSLIKVKHDIRVRFNETDPLGIVWHGNYLIYFEEGREAFGRKYNISYLDIKAQGFVTPIVKSVCEHKLPLKYGDLATIETSFINSEAAKLIFSYKIFNLQNQLVCKGETVQVFVNLSTELSLVNPPFFDTWKKHWGLQKSNK